MAEIGLYANLLLLYIKHIFLQENKLQESGILFDKLEKMESQASIRSMFNEIKKTAYAVASSSQAQKPLSLLNINK